MDSNHRPRAPDANKHIWILRETIFYFKIYVLIIITINNII